VCGSTHAHGYTRPIHVGHGYMSYGSGQVWIRRSDVNKTTKFKTKTKEGKTKTRNNKTKTSQDQDCGR